MQFRIAASCAPSDLCKPQLISATAWVLAIAAIGRTGAHPSQKGFGPRVPVRATALVRRNEEIAQHAEEPLIPLSSVQVTGRGLPSHWAIEHNHLSTSEKLPSSVGSPSTYLLTNSRRKASTPIAPFGQVRQAAGETC